MRAEVVVYGSGVPMGALARLEGTSGWLRGGTRGDEHHQFFSAALYLIGLAVAK